jgi:hypothetical protein
VSVSRYAHILSFGQEGKAFFKNTDSDVTRRETRIFVSSKWSARAARRVSTRVCRISESNQHV